MPNNSEPIEGDTTHTGQPPPSSAYQAGVGMMPVIYQELRALAYQFFRTERCDHTLQPTAVVHEVYLRLTAQRKTGAESKAEFIASAIHMIRRILVDHARKHLAAKRGGGRRPVTIDEAIDCAQQQDESLIDLDEALTRLAELDPRKSRIIELRFFGGMTEPQTADLLEISTRTVRREWRLARAWLRRELDPQEGARP